MRLLFVNEYADPHFVSGAEYSMSALADELSKNNKLVVLSPNLGRSTEPTRTNNLKFPFFKDIKPGEILSPIWFNNPFFWLYAAYFIYKTIKQKNIDLIHVHGKYILPAAIIASRLAQVPVVITVRDFKFLCPLALCYTHQQKHCTWRYYLNQEISEYRQRYHKTSKIKLIMAKLWQQILKYYLTKSDQVIAVSPQLAKIYQQAGIKNTISIYNLPPTSTHIKKRPTKLKTVLSVGKLSYGKGTDSLLHVANQLPQYQFILAGSKNVSLKQPFPPNVKYLGQLPHQQVLKLYQQADVFIILSRWPEPLSRAGLEALSFGLPIIASNRGGNQELINQNGYLVNPDKPKAIKQSINKIFKADLIKLGQNSLKLLQTRFNRTKILNQHQKLYQQLIS